MQIEHITIRNFRSLEDVTISFGDFYSAISGKNNSGKTTVLKAIRIFFDEDSPFEDFDGEEMKVNVKGHYPHWKKKEEKKKPIEFDLCLTIHKTKDAGLFKFIDTFVSLNCSSETFRLNLGLSFAADGTGEPKLSLLIDEKKIEEEFKAQEIHRRIKRSEICLFHNSTQSRHPYFIRHSPWATFSSIPLEEKVKINKAREALTKRLKKAASRQKEDLTALLGRLEEKYDVGISIPTLDFENLPMILSLGDKKMDVPLRLGKRHAKPNTDPAGIIQSKNNS